MASQRDDADGREVAASLDATPDLLPLLPELLADLDALGSFPERIVELLRPLDLAPGARVLDLGSGKGAVALALARALGVSVRGVDLFAPFVAAARERALALGLDALCRFEHADLRDALTAAHGQFDVVLYASLDVLGRHDECVAALRRAARPGGWLVVDDLYLTDGAPPGAPGYAHGAPRDEVLRRLARHGDRVVAEAVLPPAEARAANRRNTELIRRRAEALARRRPADAARIRAYVARQEQECARLDAWCIPATWLLQRGP